jgi:hypothetical protein
MRLVHLNNYFHNISLLFDIAIERYNPEITYTRDTVFVANVHQYPLAVELLEQGHKVVVENIQEICVTELLPEKYNVRYLLGAQNPVLDSKFICVPFFFWYKESMQFDHRACLRNYNGADLKFLLMMNYQRPFRDTIHNYVDTMRHQGLYSYVDRGIQMPDDLDKNTGLWDRYINIDWYNSTQFSVVVETTMTYDPGTVFLTEKTMKPLSLQHPFITLGCAGSLDMLHQAGFETFENLFDESYDTIINETDRIKFVLDQVEQYQLKSYDNITKEKLEHNVNKFYNRTEVKRRFYQDVICPIENFANEQT